MYTSGILTVRILEKGPTTTQYENYKFSNSMKVNLALETYLNSFLHKRQSYPRVRCCGSSKSLYCSECYNLLVPRPNLPLAIQKGHLDLPFDLDIVLNDRRRSASGIHAAVLIKASQLGRDESIREGSHVQIFDVKKGDNLPCYSEHFGEINTGTFVLFPSKSSVPISKVAGKLSKLIVLDCKWTRTVTQQCLPSLVDIPQVHLEFPPEESFFWRYHNAGPGMLSTLEAIYFAAFEIMNLKNSFSEDNKNALNELMWLFGIQRAAIASSSEREEKPLPFSTEGKEYQRNLRRTEKGSEKHLRDIEKGKKLQQMKKNGRDCNC